MAERPVFIPAPDIPGFVREKILTIKWAGGFAAVQKKKNIRALHDAAEAIGIWPTLEASTKSDEKLGQHLSAFNLKVKTGHGDLPLECVYQGSKVFERAGPFTDLLYTDPRSAKRDPRLHNSGKLVAFLFEGHKFPLEPKTIFYDWLYITAIFPHRDWLDRLSRYAAFSDIEFNPQKSVNCQARSLALFVSLKATCLLDDAVRSPQSFIEIMRCPMRQSVGALAEAPAIIGNSLAKPERAAAIPAQKEVSQDASHAPLTSADPRAKALHRQELEGAAPLVCAVNVETLLPNEAIPIPVPEPLSPSLNFETFLRKKALRKPVNSGQTRRKRDTQKSEKIRQTAIFDWSPVSEK